MTRPLLVAAGLFTMLVTAKVQYAGVNIAGCDFTCTTDGFCAGIQCPNAVAESQMDHFSKEGFNIFRLPVGWQYLVNNKLGGQLDENFMPTYDELVDICVKTGARCIIDVHNYARWNGNIVGQSGGAVTDDHLVSLWSQLAVRYGPKSDKITFGIMNEPHSTDGQSDFSMDTWAATLNKVVAEIRGKAGSKHWILLSGTNFDNLGAFASQSLPALSTVKNPDGSTNNLIYEVHQYYDSDSSGKNTDCQADHVQDMNNLWNALQGTGRQAILTETGGGNTGSCDQYICGALDWMNYHSDVFLGWVGWAAGSFDNSYALTETPLSDGTDTELVRNCVLGKFTKSNSTKRRAASL